MREQIIVKVTKGRLLGTEFTFDTSGSFLVGRQNDCAIAVPDTKVSRHHCEIDSNPPHVQVRDRDSLNGTYLNGVLIGKRDWHRDERVVADAKQGFVKMKDGDRLGIGSECELTLYVPGQKNGTDENIAGYILVELLARGGVGKVWRVRKEQTGDEFVLKVVSMQGIGESDYGIFFLREANLAGQLDHPCIVKQYDSGAYQDRRYIVQELCSGGNVNDLMDRIQAPLSLDTATHIIFQVLDALDFAHHAKLLHADGRLRTGIVHRDIHPGNILLMDKTERPMVKIGDFGLSKLFEVTGCTSSNKLFDPTKTGDFAGVPEFTSRTQIKYYKTAKPEVDVWAAAATYYYMLTGMPPKDLGYAEKWHLALIENAIPIRERNPAVPQKVAEVIDAALVEEPEISCKSARKLKEKIEAAL